MLAVLVVLLLGPVAVVLSDCISAPEGRIGALLSFGKFALLSVLFEPVAPLVEVLCPVLVLFLVLATAAVCRPATPVAILFCPLPLTVEFPRLPLSDL